MNIQPEEKKLKSEEKKQKSEEKKPKIEVLKSQFVLFGQVINLNYFIEKETSDFTSQDTIQEPIKVEADPSLFAIDDDSSNKPQEQKPKVEVKEAKNTPTKPVKTYEIVSYQASEFFKCEKDNKKSGFANVTKIHLN